MKKQEFFQKPEYVKNAESHLRLEEEDGENSLHVQDTRNAEILKKLMQREI